ncbi:MAG: ATP-binding cassette domain-containing protein [Propioniciclava sp.]
MRVTLDQVGHRFPGHPWLFQNLTITLEPSVVYGLVGPSGSGKSTLLSLLAGMAEPAAGGISRSSDESIGWVFQNPHGVARRTTLDHVTLPLLAKGLTRADADAAGLRLLGEVGLSSLAGRQFGHLSGGEAQRLMLARGIAMAPGMLLVDEPTAQLDQHTAGEVNAVLAKLSQSGAVVVVATHDSRTKDACHQVIDLGSATYADS